MLLFEDHNVLGFVTEHPSVGKLLASWEAQQEIFLRKHAGRLRADPVKAWNLYCIYLSAEAPSPDEAHRLAEVEEDFRACRKIARAAVCTRTDVQRALLPLLPIQPPSQDSHDSDRLLTEKLDSREQTMLRLIREEPFEASRVISWLLETT
jgi:hypothetical protein